MPPVSFQASPCRPPTSGEVKRSLRQRHGLRRADDLLLPFFQRDDPAFPPQSLTGNGDGFTIIARGVSRRPREASAQRSRPQLSISEVDAMPSTTAITVSQLSAGSSACRCAAARRCAHRRRLRSRPAPAPGLHPPGFQDCRKLGGRACPATSGVICQKGQKLSQGVAGWLRHDGIAAEFLEGGFEAWKGRTAS